MADEDLKLPARSKKKAAAPEAIEVTRTMRALKPRQRLAIDALIHSRTQSEAIERLAAAGVVIDKAVMSRWLRKPAFMRAYKAREAAIAALVTRDSVVVNAQKIYEEALTPKPILHRGNDTGFREVELGAALTANEQLGKAVGAFGLNQDGKTVIVIDIDFSGRKAPVQERQFVDGQEVTDAEFSEVEPGAPAHDVVEAKPEPSWLD